VKKLLFILLFVMTIIYAKDVTTVNATDGTIGENLDLEVVASVFGESKDLEEFEKKINDPEAKITNLDLNEDGEVDYLRVVETSKNDTKLVTIQAVIGKDEYQDVATIDVEKDSKGETQVQVVGDVYMYGPDYVITPVYVHPPVIYLFFWGAIYRPWRSPFYWGFYPPYYHPWRPYPRSRYRRDVRVNVNINNSYNHTTIRNSKTSIDLQKDTRRNDFGKKNPDKSFAKTSKKDKVDKKDVKKPSTVGDVKSKSGTVADSKASRKVDKDWKTKKERKVNKSNNPVSKKDTLNKKPKKAANPDKVQKKRPTKVQKPARSKPQRPSR